MAQFSFDIVSDYDKAEINNVHAAAEREIAGRYDFKGTPAAIEWLSDKSGFIITGAGPWQCETLVDIIRKKLINRGQSSKLLDLSRPITETNLIAKQEIPFKKGLSQDIAKQITALLRTDVPKVKAQIQGDTVRVSGTSKDDLQQAMTTVKDTDLDLPLQFINYR